MQVAVRFNLHLSHSHDDLIRLLEYPSWMHTILLGVYVRLWRIENRNNEYKENRSAAAEQGFHKFMVPHSKSNSDVAWDRRS